MNFLPPISSAPAPSARGWRWLAGLAALLAVAAGHAQQPTDGSVLAGSATISSGTGLTTITAGNNSVLRWGSFDVGAGETVHFIQPGADARVLNLIGGLTPSQINGSLLANGQVYLMNPAGVYFGSTAVVNVGALYAAGGSMTKEDFLSGVNRFTGLTGDVTNAGSIRGDMVALVGRSVANTGSIVSAGGFIGLASGEQVLIGQNGSSIYVDAGHSATTADLQAGAGVTNTGTVDAGTGSTVLAAGDLYAIAITQDGRLAGRDIRVQGQGRGDVLVSGTIDASASGAGETGGRVEITGERVGLTGSAKVDASGAAGGGTILVGGDYQGGNAGVRNAVVTYVGADTTLNADATQSGNGGKVIVWADDATRFGGNIFARGGALGGNGGFAEVSGKGFLNYQGLANLTASTGITGTLLLDPTDITITGAGVDAGPNVGSFTGGIFDGGANDASTISIGTGVGDVNSTLLKQLASANVVISTTSAGSGTGNITVSDTVSYTSTNSLTLTAGNNLVVNSAITNTGTGDLVFSAGAAGVVNAAISTAGDLSFTTGTTLDLGANVTGSTSVSFTNGDALSQASGIVTGATLTLDGAGAVATLGTPLVTAIDTLILAKPAGDTFLSDTGTLTVQGSTAGGNLTATAGGALTLGVLNLGAGSLTATAGGHISQTGALNVGGTLTAAVTAPGSDILINFNNNLGTTAPVFSGTLANIRDVSLRNNNAGAQLPSFAGLTNLRSLTLMFNNAAIALPTLSLATGGSLTVNAGTTLTVGGDLTTAGGGIYLTGGTGLTVDGNVTTVGGGIGLTATTGTLTQNPTRTIGSAAGISLRADNIVLNGASGSISGTGNLLLQPVTDSRPIVIGAAGGAGDFALDASELATLAGGFAEIFIGSASSSGGITVGGPVTFNDPVNLQSQSGGDIVVNHQITGAGNASITLWGFGSNTYLNANLVTQGAAIAINDSVVLGAPTVTLDTTNAGGNAAGAGIAITGAVNGTTANTESLVLNAGSGGAISMDSTVGVSTSLASLTVANSNGASFAGDVTMGTSVVLTDTTDGQAIQFGGALTTPLLTTGAGAYHINFFGGAAVTADTTFANTGEIFLGNGAGDSLTFAGGLDTTAASLTRVGGTVATTNTAMDLGAVVLLSDSTVKTGSGALTLGSVTDGASTFDLTLQEDAAGSTGAVTFAGGVTIDDLITFGRDYAVTLQGAVNTFGSQVTFLNTGAVTLGNAAGDSFLFDAGLDTTAAATTHLGGQVRTSGDAIAFSALSLVDNATVDTTNNAAVAAGANVTFAGSVNADDAAANDRTLGIDAGSGGTVLFQGSVGGTQALADLDVSAATIAFQTATVNINDDNAAAATVNLGGNVELRTGTVTLNTDKATGTDNNVVMAAVDADSAASNRALVVTAGTGTVTVTDIGGAQALADLDITAATINLNGSTVDVSAGTGGADITFGGAVVLGNDLTVNTNGAADNNLTFGSTIDADDSTAANRILTVDAGGGTVRFGGNIGAGTNGRLAGLDITAGSIIIAGSVVRLDDDDAPGASSLNGTVRLENNVTIDLGDNNLTFGGTVDSFDTTARDLTINAAAGNITFSNALGSIQALDALDVESTTGLIALGGNITTAGIQAYTGDVRIDGDVALVTTDSLISFGGTVNSQASEANDLTIDTGTAGVTFGAAVGGGTDGTLGALSITNTSTNGVALSAVTAQSLTVSTGGDITQTAAATIAGAASFSTGDAAITLTNTANAFTGAVSLNNGGTGNVAIVNNGSLVLGASTLGGGTFEATSVGGSISQTGGAFTKTGGAATFTIDTGTNQDILLHTQANNFGGGAVAFTTANGGSIRDFGLRDGHSGASLAGLPTAGRNVDLHFGGAGIVLPSLNVTGILNVTAGGAITQVGGLTVAGVANFTTGAFGINLGNASNDFSDAVSLTNSGAFNVAVRDANAILLGGANLGSGTLIVDAVGITQTGAIIQSASAGTATFNAGAGEINLTHSGNDFTGSVSLNNGGANNVAVRDANGLVLGTSAVGSGTLAITSVGLSQTGAVTQAASGGTVTINAGAGLIALTDSNNDFTGAVTLTNSGANDISLTDANALTLNTPTVGRHLIITSGALTLGGSVSTGSNDLTLNTTTLALGSNTLTGGTVTLNHSAGLTGTGLITAGTLNLDGLGAVGMDADNRIQTTAGTIDFNKGSGAGASFLAETDTVTLTGTTDGALNITAAGEVSLTGLTAAGGFSAPGADIALTGTITGAMTFDSDVTVDGTTVFAGAVTMGNTGGLLTFDADNNAVTFNSTLTLTGDTTFTGGTGALVFSTISGGTTNLDLTINAGSGGVSLSGVTGLASLTVTGTANVAGTFSTDGNTQNWGNLVLTANAAFTDATGDINFNGTVDTDGTAWNLTASTTAGDVTFAQAVGAATNGELGTLDVTASGMINLNGGSITTSGAQNYNTAVTLGAATTLDSNGANILFSSTLDAGNRDLVIAVGTAAGTTTFTGAVSNLGDGTGAAFTANSTGLVRFMDAVGAASGLASTNAAGATRFDGDVTLADGDTASSFAGTAQFDGLTWSGFDGLTVTGAASLSTGAVTINSNGGNILFSSTLAGGNQDLILAAGTAAGTTTFTGAVSSLGDGTGAAFTTGSTGLVRFMDTVGGTSGLVSTNGSGATRFDADVTLTDGNTGSSFAGTALFDGLTWSGFDGLTVTGAATLSGAGVTLNSNGGNILFSSTLDAGNQDLVIAAGTAAGTTTFTDAVSNLGDGTGAAFTSGSTGLVRFMNTVDAASGLVSTDGSGATRFDANVTLADGNTASSFAGTAQFDGLTWSGFDGLTVTGAASLSTGAVTFDSNGGNILFSSTLDGGNQDLVIAAGTAAGTTTFTGAVSNLGDGTGAAFTTGSTGLVRFMNTVGAASGLVSTDSSGATRFDGDVTLADGDTASSFAGTALFDALTWSGFDGLTVTGAASLATGAVTIDSNGGNILFSSTLAGGNQDLIVAAGTGTGTTTFTGAVSNLGDGTGAAFTTGSTGLVRFMGTVGGASGLVSTDGSGSTRFDDNVTLTDGDTGSSFAGTALFDGLTWSGFDGLTVTGAASLATSAVTLNSNGGNILFSSTLAGGNQDLILAAGTAAGTTTFTGAVSNLGDGTGAAFTANSTGLVRFMNTVGAASGLASTDGSGSTRFDGDVTLADGDTASSFASTAQFDGLTWNGFDGLTVTGAASLSTSAATINSNGGNILFSSTLDGGNQDLVIAAGTAAGTTIFTGAVSNLGDGTGAAFTTGSTGLVRFMSTVGGASGLVSTDGSGSTRFDDNVTLTDGNTGSSFTGTVLFDGLTWSGFDGLTVTGAASLATSAVTLNSNGGNILFSSTLDGGSQDLVIAVGTAAGTTTFTGVVSNLGDGAGAAFTAGSTGLVRFMDTVGAASGLVSTDGSGATRFDGAVTLADGNTASSFAGTVQFDGLTWSGFDGLTVTGAASLATGPVTLNSNGGNILFSSTLDGGSQDLVIAAGTAAGTTTFTGAVSNLGDGTGAAFIANSTGLVRFMNTVGAASGLVSTDGSGATRFDGDVTLADGNTASSFAGTAQFDGLTWSGFDGLTVMGAASLSTGAVTIDSNGSNILFSSTLNGGNQDLIVAAGTAAGTTTFTGAVSNLGDGTGAAFTTGSTGLVRFMSTVGGASGLVSTDGSGATRFDDNVTLTDGDTGSSFTGTGLFDGLTWSGFDGLTVTGAASLATSAVTLNSNGGNILFSSTLAGGNQDLVIAAGTAAGTTTFTGAVSSLGDGTGAAFTANSTGLVRFMNTVGAASGLVSTDGSGATRFDGDVTLANGDTASSFAGTVQFDGLAWSGFDGLTVTGAASLSTAAVTLDSNGGNILFSSTLAGGNQDLVIAAGTGAGTTTFTGAVSNLGDGAGAAFTTGSTGLVRFMSTVGGASGLVSTDGSGATRFDGDVTLTNGDTGSSFAGTAQFDGLTWSGFDGLTVTGAASLSTAAVTLNSNGGNILFSSTLDGGNQDLVIAAGTAPGTTTFTGAVSNLGDGTGAAFTAASTGLVRFMSTVGGASGLVSTDSLGATRFDNNVTLTDGDTASSFAGTAQFDGLTWSGFDGLTVTGAASLSTAAVTINSNGGNILFSSTLNGGGQDLIIAAGTAAGTTTFTGAVSNLGDGTGAAFTADSTGLVRFMDTVGAASGLVSTDGSGATRFDGDVTLADGNTASSFAGTAQFDGFTWSGFDGLTVTGAASLSTGAVTINSNGGNILFSSTLAGGNQDLVIAAGTATGTTTFTGAVSSLGDGTGAAFTTGSTGLVRFMSTVGGASGLVSTDGSGSTRFDDNVTLADGDTASSFAGTALFDGLTWSGFDGLTVSGAASLATSAVTLNSNGGNILFSSTLDGGNQDLVIAAGTATGTTTFTGAISNLGDGTGAAFTAGSTGLVRFMNTVDAASGLVSTDGSGATRFDNNVTLTDGDTASSFAGTAQFDGLTWSGFDGLTVTGAASLSTATVTLDSNGGNILFSSTLAGGNQDLVVAAGAGAGTTTFTGAVSNLGDGTGASFIANSTGLVRFMDTVGAASGLVSTSAAGATRFDGDVTLANGDTASSFTGTAQFDGLTWSGFDGLTVTGAASLSTSAVTINSNGGNVLFSSTLDGGNQDLVIAAGTAAGTTTFTGAVSNLGDGTGAAFTTGSTGLVRFMSTVGGASGLVSTNGSGATRFDADVTLTNGDTGSSFAGTAQFDGLTWSGFDGLTVTGAASLSTAAVTIDSNGGNILFSSTLGGGNQDLVIAAGTAAGTTTFTGAVSNLGDGTGAAFTADSTGLVRFMDTVGPASGFVSTNAAGATRFDADVTLTNGDTASSFAGTAQFDGLTWSGFDGLTVTGAASLSTSAVTINSNGGNILFSSTLAGGNQDLVIAAGTGAGTATFTGAVSNLGDGTGAAFTADSTGLVRFMDTVGAASGLVSTNAAGATRFDADVTLANGDTASSFAGTVQFDGLTWSGFDGLTVTGAASLSTSAVTLNSNGGNILFSSTLDGGNQDMVIAAGTAAGTTTFTGAVSNLGDGTGAAFTADSTGLVRFMDTVGAASGFVSTNAAGATRFDGDVTLSDGNTASSFAGTAQFDGLTWSGFDGLTVTGAASLSTSAVTINSNGGNILFSSTLDGGNQDLVIAAGTAAGTTTFTGAVSNLGDGTGAAFTADSTGLVRFMDTVNAASGLVSTNAAGATRFDGDVTLANGDTASSFAGTAQFDGLTWSGFDGLTVTGAASLSTSAVTINSNGGNILFSSTLDGGNQDLIVAAGTAAGTTTFTGAVSNLGDGTGAAFTTGSTGLVRFMSTVGGASGLVSTDASGSTRFDDNVTLTNGDTASNFAGTVQFDGLIWSGFDGLTVTGATSLSTSAVTLDSNGGNILFSSTLDGGNQDLVIAAGTAAGTTTFTGAVSNLGDGTGAAFTADSTGLVRFMDTVAAASGLVSTNAAGATRFDGDVTLTNGDTASSFAGTVQFDGLTWNGFDGLTVTGATSLSTSAVTINSNGGNILFSSALDGGNQDLVIAAGTAAGTTTFTGAVSNLGDGTGAAFTADSTGLVRFMDTVGAASGLVSTNGAGATRFDADVTLTNGDTASSFAGTAQFDGLTWSGFDGLTVTGAASLSTSAVTINSNGGNILFSSTLDGGNQDLVIAAGTAAGTTTFTGAVSNLGDGTGAAFTTGSTGLVRFMDTVVAASGLVSTNAAGTTRFDADVTLTNGDTPSSFAGTAQFDGLTWSGFDGLTVTGATSLSTSAVTINANGGNILFSSTVDGGNQDLVIAAGTAAGTTTFTGAVSNLGDGTGAAFTANSTGLVRFMDTVGAASGLVSTNAAGATRFDADVTLTNGDTASSFAGTAQFDGLTWSGFDGLTVTGAASLSTSAVTINANGANILFSSTLVGGNQDLVIAAGTAAGTTTFTGAVSNLGDGTGAAFTADSTGLVRFMDTVGAASGLVSTNAAGATRFDADVTLTNGDTASSFAGTAQFDGLTWSGFDGLTVTGATSLSTSAVTINANGGNILFSSTVDGGNQDLVIAAGTAAGTTTFASAVSNLGDGTGAAFTANSTGLVRFMDTVGAASGLVSTNAAGATRFDTDVTLANGNTASSFAGTVQFDGLTWTGFDGLTVTGAASLSTSAVTINSNSGNILFSSTLDGGQALTLNAGAGNVTFTGVVGATPLDAVVVNSTGLTTLSSTFTAASLTTDAGGTTALNANVTTTGAQVYNDSVRIDSDLTLATTNSPVAFAGTIDSQASEANDLTINTGAGAATFGGTIGGAVNGQLGALTINNTAAGVILPSLSVGTLTVTTSGAITDIAGAALSVTGLATLNAGTNAITLGDNVADVANFGSLNLNGTVVTITEDSATVLTGTNTATTLSLTSAGSITDAAATSLTVDGLATFNAGANAITLGDNAGDTTNFGTVNLTGTAVTLTEDSATDLAGVNATTLTLTSPGHITQSGVLNVTGQTTLTVTTPLSDILLGTQANDLGTLAPIFGGTVTNIRDVSIRNINPGAQVSNFTPLTSLRNLTLIYNAAPVALPALHTSGNISVTAGGDITDLGALVIDGTALFTAPGFNITLDNSGTNFSSIQLTGATINITDVDVLALAGVLATGPFSALAVTDLTVSAALDGASTINLTARDGNLVINAPVTTSGGNLNLTAGRNYVQSTAGPLTTSGGAITIQTGGSAEIASLVTRGGNVTVTSGSSATFISPLDVSGVFQVTSGGDVSFNNTLTGAGALTVTTNGITSFNAAITSLGSLVTTTGGSTVLGGGRLDVTGFFRFDDPVVVTAATTLISGPTGRFNSTLSGGTDGGQALSFNLTGDTIFVGAVGGTNVAAGRRFASITTSDTAGRTLFYGGSVLTTGAQIYNDPVLLGSVATSGNPTITMGASALTFNNTVVTAPALVTLSGGSAATTGQTDLIANVTGATQFNSPVGQGGDARRLGDVTINGGSTAIRANFSSTALTVNNPLRFDGAAAITVDTTGMQLYAGLVELGASTDLLFNTTLNASFNPSAPAPEGIRFAQGISAAGRTVSITAPGSAISTGGDIGSSGARLQALSAGGRYVVVGGNIWTQGDIKLSIGTGTSTDNDFLQFTGPGDAASSTRLDSAVGEIILGSGATGGADKTDAPSRASIFKSNAGDLNLFARKVTIQPYERLLVRNGSLVVIADGTDAGDGITLSSTAATNYIILVSSAPLLSESVKDPQSASIRIRSRDAADVDVINQNISSQDQGTELVAGAIYFFNVNFKGIAPSPTREAFAPVPATESTFSYQQNFGNVLTNVGPRVVGVLPDAQGDSHNVYVADLVISNKYRPIVGGLIYLDLSTAPGFRTGNQETLMIGGLGPFINPDENLLGLSGLTPMRTLSSANSSPRASLQQGFTPNVPLETREAIPPEVNLSPAVREQLQALGIYARALRTDEDLSRKRRMGLFVTIPERERPREPDYQVAEARVENRAVQEVLRLANDTGLIGEGQQKLDEVATSLANSYNTFTTLSPGGTEAKDFRAWLEKSSEADAKRVLEYVTTLNETLKRIELLGLTRQELASSKAQIYGSILRARLNAEPEFLRALVEESAAPARVSALVPPASSTGTLEMLAPQ